MPAPWDGPTLELEPGTEPADGYGYLKVPEQLQLLLDTEPSEGADALARVMLAAGALYAHRKGSLSQCMRTAVLWERG